MIKKLLHGIGALLCCAVTAGEAFYWNRPLEVYTAVAPVAWLVGEIGDEYVKAHAAVPFSRSPHDYQPTPQELAAICGSDVYLSADLVFENRVILPFLAHTELPCREIGQSIVRIPVAEGDHAEHGAGTDQHIWLSADNAVILTRDIAAVLSEMRPEQQEYFAEQADGLIEEFQTIAKEGREALKPYEGRPFIIYHPALGYMARDFQLRELAIECDGKLPTPRRLKELTDIARENDIRVILMEPQYNRAPALALANSLGAELVMVNPLVTDLVKNLRSLVKQLEKGFE